MTALLDSVLEAARPHVAGRVARVLGLNLEVVGLQLPIGSAVSVETDHGPVIAEVVAIRDDERSTGRERVGVAEGAEIVGMKARDHVTLLRRECQSACEGVASRLLGVRELVPDENLRDLERDRDHLILDVGPGCRLALVERGCGRAELGKEPDEPVREVLGARARLGEAVVVPGAVAVVVPGASPVAQRALDQLGSDHQ